MSDDELTIVNRLEVAIGTLQTDNANLKVRLDRAHMEQEVLEDRIERYEKMIDFIQRYVLDEI